MSGKVAYALIGYGIFLALVGLSGYLSNPEKAKTALISGGTFGALSIFWGILVIKKIAWAPPAALGTALFLLAIFTWRASDSWIRFSQGETDKIVAASLISLMWVGSLTLIVFLFRQRRPRSRPAA